MQDVNNKPSPEKLTEEMKKDALDKLDEITQGMTRKQKEKVIEAIRTGKIRIMSKEEIEELKAKGAKGADAVPLKKGGAGPKFTKPINTPQKKAARKKNRASSKARARNRR